MGGTPYDYLNLEYLLKFFFEQTLLKWSEKLWVENGEAICSFGEAIAFYDYSVSSAGSFSS